MKKFGSNQDFRILLIARCNDRFIEQLAAFLSEYEVDFTVCDNIYSAIARLWGEKAGKTLVIGRLEELCAEKGRFFEKIGQMGFSCCCLADTNARQNTGWIEAAAGEGAFVVENTEQIFEAVRRYLESQVGVIQIKRKEKSALALLTEEFVTTQAELDALLGG